MSHDYTAYITAAYAICFVVLSWIIISSILAWRKINK